VIAFTEDGKVIDDMQDPSGTYPQTTGAMETNNLLYIQRVNDKGIDWLSK
jgi:hypothetical protein